MEPGGGGPGATYKVPVRVVGVRLVLETMRGTEFELRETVVVRVTIITFG